MPLASFNAMRDFAKFLRKCATRCAGQEHLAVSRGEARPGFSLMRWTIELMLCRRYRAQGE